MLRSRKNWQRASLSEKRYALYFGQASALNGRFTRVLNRRLASGQGPEGGMKTGSRDQGRTAGVGLVKRPSLEFGAMGETRRKPPFSSPDRTITFDP
jgi:hypothetical protein